jgi:hypothetical protein
MAQSSFESDMKRMQDLFGILRHEYDLYFAGTRKGQPSRERAELERLVKYYSNGNLNRLSQQFLFNAFASKFTLHREQWNKWLRAKEEGLVEDPRLIASTLQAKKTLYELEKGSAGRPQAGAAREPKEEPAAAVKIQKSANGKPIRSLYDDFISAKLQAGMAPEWDYEAFESHLKKQREAILSKYAGKDVVFSVLKQDGKVSLKAKVIK